MAPGDPLSRRSLVCLTFHPPNISFLIFEDRLHVKASSRLPLEVKQKMTQKPATTLPNVPSWQGV